MKTIPYLLAQLKPKTFKLNYAPDYKSFIYHYVATDPAHPLYEAQKRRQRDRKKEGLWWHATTGVDLSKLSCVRTWARRRLRSAVVEELKARGYDEQGNPLETKVTTGWGGMADGMTGSLRFHGQVPLLPAKYVDVKQEVGQVLDALLNGATGGTSGQRSANKYSLGRQQLQKSSAGMPPQFRVRRSSPNVHAR